MDHSPRRDSIRALLSPAYAKAFWLSSILTGAAIALGGLSAYMFIYIHFMLVPFLNDALTCGTDACNITDSSHTEIIIYETDDGKL